MADLFEFGPFTLDRVKRTLARDGQAVPLTSKAFDLLAFLADHPGETVTKQAILDAVWPGTAVEENTLARSVSMVRKALGEHPADHQYIVTVPGVGYRFIGEPTPPAPEPLVVRRPTWRWIAALAVLAAGVLAGIGWYRTLPPGRYTPRRLTSNGRVIKASVSPDGTRAVYAAGSIGEESLEIVDIASGKTTVLVPPANTHYLGLDFDPSGRAVYAPAKVPTEPVAVLWRIDASTGARERILDDIESNVSFSPDGKQFAFIRALREPSEHALMIRDASGAIRRLAGIALPEWIDYPSWSPDGRVIACTHVDVTRRHGVVNRQVHHRQIEVPGRPHPPAGDRRLHADPIPMRHRVGQEGRRCRRHHEPRKGNPK